MKQRCADGEKFHADQKIGADLKAFLGFAPQNAGALDAAILQARVRVRDGSYTVVGELEKLQKKPASREQSLLLLQLLLICKDRDIRTD